LRAAAVWAGKRSSKFSRGVDGLHVKIANKRLVMRGVS
jgi:hypothetical protein